jgi:hypothetical protein
MGSCCLEEEALASLLLVILYCTSHADSRHLASRNNTHHSAWGISESVVFLHSVRRHVDYGSDNLVSQVGLDEV